KESRSVLEPLAAKADAPADVLLALASRLDEDGDAAGAEALYRRVIVSPGTSPGTSPVAAQNSLAMLLAHRGGALSLAEARKLIDDAIAAAPAVAALHDTRAFVLARAGDASGALASAYAAIQLQPASAES